jgi:hypothetical protein
MIPGKNVIVGRWHLTASCSAGGRHEWVTTEIREESEDEIRTYMKCQQCGEGLWHVITKSDAPVFFL